MLCDNTYHESCSALSTRMFDRPSRITPIAFSSTPRTSVLASIGGSNANHLALPGPYGSVVCFSFSFKFDRPNKPAMKLFRRLATLTGLSPTGISSVLLGGVISPAGAADGVVLMFESDFVYVSIPC